MAGATLYGTPGAADADLFSIYALLKTQLSAAAATVFAVALLLSGQSAGLVVTLAGRKFYSPRVCATESCISDTFGLVCLQKSFLKDTSTGPLRPGNDVS